MLPIERDLIGLDQFKHPVGARSLSLYLDTEWSRGGGRSLDARIEAVIHPVRSALKDDALEVGLLDEAVEMARAAIDSLSGLPRAVAVFACPDPRFVTVVPLPDPTVSIAHWSENLQVKLLLAALDEHERTIVVLVDKPHGHVYRVFLGQIEEVAHLDRESRPFESDRHAQRKSLGGIQGGTVRMGYGEPNDQRRDEWNVHQHLESVLRAIRESKAGPADRFLVGGGRETVHELLRLLPKRILHRTRLISGLAVGATAADVLARVMATQAQAEREHEEELVDNLTERDHAHAVFGAAAVLEAVSDARVHTLVYGAGLSIQGHECTECGWMTDAPRLDACARCGGAVKGVPDMLERMIWLVAHAGGRIEEVRGPALKSMAKWQSLAALLRFTPGANDHAPMRSEDRTHRQSTSIEELHHV